MNGLSTLQVAKKLGMSNATLSRYILMGKVPAPPEVMVAGMRLRLWNEDDIERLRTALPKAKNGRKTRYKKHSALSNQQSAKTKPRESKTKRPKAKS